MKRKGRIVNYIEKRNEKQKKEIVIIVTYLTIFVSRCVCSVIQACTYVLKYNIIDILYTQNYILDMSIYIYVKTRFQLV